MLNEYAKCSPLSEFCFNIEVIAPPRMFPKRPKESGHRQEGEKRLGVAREVEELERVIPVRGLG